ncbi:hypothetical protein ACLB1T_30640 [Escherichia coli]
MIADNNDLTTLTATVADTEGNAIANTEVTFTLPEDVKAGLANEAVTFTLPADVSASFTLGQGGSAITDINGKAEVTSSGTKSAPTP